MRTSATAFYKYDYKHRLFQALEENNLDQVKLILQREPSLIDSVDQRGDTPLHKVINKLDDREKNADIIQIITYMLAKNAQLTIPDRSGETALSLMTKLSPVIAINFLNALQNSVNNPNEHEINTNNLSISTDAQCLRL